VSIKHREYKPPTHLISFKERKIVDFLKFDRGGNTIFPGITVHCPGSPGHGSRFVENTAAEKLVSVISLVYIHSF